MRKMLYMAAIFIMTIIPAMAYANPTVDVPEPMSLLLAAIGLGAAGLAGWRKRK
jgi:hypothetical protein